VKKKEEAKADYDAAVNSGVSAFLLEESGRPDIFQISVGRLAPGAVATILLTYIMEVPLDEASAAARLTIPTTIAPKYVPLTDDSEAAKKIASIDYDFKTPAPLSFQLTAEMSSRVLGVKSPSHPGIETTGGDVAVAGTFVAVTKFGGGRTTADLDRDIVVLVETAEANEAQVRVEQGGPGGSNLLLLSYVPRFSVQPQGTELIFLVDCSGSMHGEGIKMAGEALQLFLHSLPVNAFFNIFCFGSTYRSLFPESRRYDDDTLGRAKQLAAQLNADLGGTEIYAPLEAIVKGAAIADSPRQIFVLTDGQVSNTAACIQLVNRHQDKNRVFTLGIGSAADRHLVKGMARAGLGTAVFTTEGESLAPKVLKQLKNAVQPSVQDFTIDWGLESGVGAAPVACQAPGRLPPVYNGTRLQVYRLLAQTAGQPLPNQVKVSARIGGTSFAQTIPVVTPAPNPSSGSSLLLHKMFARRMIQDLEENYSQSQEQEDEEKRKKKEEEVKDLVTELGLKFGLATRHTSFIAVDTAAPTKEIPTTMVSRQVPNQVAFGFGGFGGGSMAPRAMRCMAMASPPMFYAAPSLGACQPPAMACFDAPRAMTESHGGPAPPMAVRQKRSARLNAECKMPTRQALSKGNTLFSQSLMVDSAMETEDYEEVAHQDTDSSSVDGLQPSAASSTPQDMVLRLASLQSAQGSFAASPIIAEVLGGGTGGIDELVAAKPADLAVDSSVWLTGLVVVLLEERFAELRDYWELIVDKARDWLSAQLSGDLAAVEGVLVAAKKLVVVST
jgi:hypothetical protein